MDAASDLSTICLPREEDYDFPAIEAYKRTYYYLDILIAASLFLPVSIGCIYLLHHLGWLEGPVYYYLICAIATLLLALIIIWTKFNHHRKLLASYRLLSAERDESAIEPYPHNPAINNNAQDVPGTAPFYQ